MKTKRIAAIFLSLITAISLTTQTFADVVDPNAKADDGSTVAGESTLPGYDNTYDYGYRISVVDESGKSLGATDLVDPRINGVTDDWGSSTGTDKSSSGQDVLPGTLPADMPAPLHYTSTSFEGQGNAVKNYLTQKNGDGVEKVVAIAAGAFTTGGESSKELVKDLQSGKKQLIVEPILALPSYTDEPVGTTRTTSTGKQLHVVQAVNPASGRVYKYWANADGTAYTYTGTIREFVQEELGPYGSIENNFVSGVIKQTLKSFLFSEDAYDFKHLSEDEIDAMIEQICKDPALLDEIAAGAFAFSNKQAAPPPPPQPAPSTGTGKLDITESRITRHKKLSEVDNTLSSHYFKWDVPAFTIEECNYDHHKSKKITDKTNVVNIDEKEKPEEGKGVIGESKYWSFMGATLYSRFEKTWTDRNWDKQEFSYNGAEYSITVIKKDDRLNLIDYNNRNGSEAGSAAEVIKNATTFVNSGNISNNRAANGSGVFIVSLRFEPDTGVYKWTGNEYDKETVAEHTDCYDTTDENNETVHNKDPREETIQTNFDASTKLEMNLAVNWSVYAGTQNSTTNDTKANGLKQYPTYGKQETWLELNYGTVEFVPYIKMQFDTPTTQGVKVYVAGKYQRSFMANEHVGVVFNTSKNTGHNIVNTKFGNVKGKISLQSNQWSTHATAIKKAGSNCVLPGGAVLDLAILKENRQTFTVESIKPILAGSGLTQVNVT